MISTASILACIVTLFISLIGPVLIFIVYGLKNRRQGVASAWLLGALGFLIPQMVIRLPILNILNETSWFLDFSLNHIFLYCFSLAFTAGLFELAGRFAVAKWMARKKLTYQNSLAAGLGHGGIEAMLVVGMTYVNNLIFMILINAGALDELINHAAMGIGTIRDTLCATSPVMFLLAGYERILTMVVQAAMSMIVCWGVHRRKAGRGAFVCLLMHTLLDSTAMISMLATDLGGNRLTQTAAYAIVYVILTLAAIGSVWILWKLRQSWLAEETEVSNDSGK